MSLPSIASKCEFGLYKGTTKHRVSDTFWNDRIANSFLQHSLQLMSLYKSELKQRHKSLSWQFIGKKQKLQIIKSRLSGRVGMLTDLVNMMFCQKKTMYEMLRNYSQCNCGCNSFTELKLTQ